MLKNFDLEIRESDDKYLKVFVKNISIIEDVKNLLSVLPSVKNVNITNSKSNSNPSLTLTVYPKRVYSIEDMFEEVENELKRYFDGNPQIVEQAESFENQGWLANYPEVQKIYNEGIRKYKEGLYFRNILDDMRLSLEILLKNILKNKKSLENQMPDVGSYQKEKKVSSEFTNMFKKILDYYAKYQDNNVKHNDSVKPEELDFVINLTTLFMKSFINL